MAWLWAYLNAGKQGGRNCGRDEWIQRIPEKREEICFDLSVLCSLRDKLTAFLQGESLPAQPAVFCKGGVIGDIVTVSDDVRNRPA